MNVPETEDNGLPVCNSALRLQHQLQRIEAGTVEMPESYRIQKSPGNLSLASPAYPAAFGHQGLCTIAALVQLPFQSMLLRRTPIDSGL